MGGMIAGGYFGRVTSFEYLQEIKAVFASYLIVKGLALMARIGDPNEFEILIEMKAGLFELSPIFYLFFILFVAGAILSAQYQKEMGVFKKKPVEANPVNDPLLAKEAEKVTPKPDDNE